MQFVWIGDILFFISGLLLGAVFGWWLGRR